MIKTVSPSPLSGTLQVMPSKSASHRAVMMAALAKGETELSPLQLSRDIEATESATASSLPMAGKSSSPASARVSRRASFSMSQMCAAM